MTLEPLEEYIADIFTVKEALRTSFNKTGNPTLPRVIEMANDVIRRLEDLELEMMKILKDIN